MCKHYYKPLAHKLAENKSLVAAVIASIALHLLLLTNKFSPPKTDTNKFTLNVRLDKSELNYQPESMHKKSLKVASAPKYIFDKVHKFDAPTKEVSNDNFEGSKSYEKLPTETNETIFTNSTGDFNQIEVESPDIANTADQLAKKNSDEPLKFVETIYDVSYSNSNNSDLPMGNDALIGTSKITFSSTMVGESNTYSIASTLQGKDYLGITKLMSQGIINHDGLRPNYYVHKIGNEESILAEANFAWADGVVIIKSNNLQINKPTYEGMQDELSYLYQFMYNPPSLEQHETPSNQNTSGSNNYVVGNNTHFNANNYKVIGEEIIQTKLGEIKTIHILKNDDLMDKIEIWLAVDYQLIPVKIRKSEKNGSVIEQIITNISTNDVSQSIDASQH